MKIFDWFKKNEKKEEKPLFKDGDMLLYHEKLMNGETVYVPKIYRRYWTGHRYTEPFFDTIKKDEIPAGLCMDIMLCRDLYGEEFWVSKTDFGAEMIGKYIKSRTIIDV